MGVGGQRHAPYINWTFTYPCSSAQRAPKTDRHKNFESDDSNQTSQ